MLEIAKLSASCLSEAWAEPFAGIRSWKFAGIFVEKSHKLELLVKKFSAGQALNPTKSRVEVALSENFEENAKYNLYILDYQKPPVIIEPSRSVKQTNRITKRFDHTDLDGMKLKFAFAKQLESCKPKLK